MDNETTFHSGLTHDPLLLERYFAGECTPDEVRDVEAWMSARPEQQAFVESLRLAWMQTGRPSHVPAYDVDAEWRRLAARALEQTGTHDVVRTKAVRAVPTAGAGPARMFVWRRAVVAGAALVLGVLGLWVGWRVVRTGTFAQAPSAMTMYSTSQGQRAHITLPDGSTVDLNVASRLDVPANYAAGNRTLKLSGEALFTVQHENGSAFTVVAGNTTARVLGTSFSVRKYGSDTTTTIAVKTGRVAVGSHVLGAMQQAVVRDASDMQVMDARTAAFSFATGVLTLDQRLPEAIPELDRWYDVDIRIGNPVLRKLWLAGGVPAGSMTDLVTLLQLTFNVRAVRDGRVVTLYPR